MLLLTLAESSSRCIPQPWLALCQLNKINKGSHKLETSLISKDEKKENKSKHKNILTRKIKKQSLLTYLHFVA